MKHDNSNQSQRKRFLEKLRQEACTTMEARHELDIMSPAARVYELRHIEGFNIQTCWTNGDNPGGGRHRVAQYVLMPGKWKGGIK